MILFRPAALSLRFGLGVSSETDAGRAAADLDSAHLLRCASAILARAAALSFRLRLAGFGVLSASALSPFSISRRSVI
jgi:hypothetical protein